MVGSARAPVCHPAPVWRCPLSSTRAFPAVMVFPPEAVAHWWAWAAHNQHMDLETSRKSKGWSVGEREKVWGISALCLSQGAAVMVSVLHQHVFKCWLGVHVPGLLLLLMELISISKAINGAFQLSNFPKNVISHPEVFLFNKLAPKLDLQMALG